MRSLANEIGRSTVGLYRLLKPSRLVKGNNPVFFIIPSQVTNRHTIWTQKNIWKKSLANEIRRSSVRLYRLYKPSKLIKGNNTVIFNNTITRNKRHTIWTNKNIWMKSLANEIGRSSVRLYRLRKPSKLIKGNNTAFFLIPSQVTSGLTVTYCNFVCTMQSNKS